MPPARLPYYAALITCVAICSMLLLCQQRIDAQVPDEDTIIKRRIVLVGDNGEGLIVLDTKSGNPTIKMTGHNGHTFVVGSSMDGTKMELKTNMGFYQLHADTQGRIGTYADRGDKSIALAFGPNNGWCPRVIERPAG